MLPGLTVAAAMVLGVLLAPASAQAQTRLYQLGLAASSGLQMGPGADESVAAQRNPLMLDASVRTWTDERPELLWGGSLRTELEGDVGVAVAPRLELRQPLGGFEVRPGLALPVFFAPFTMFGIETSLIGRTQGAGDVGLLAFLSLAAFVAGSDLPEDGTVLMLRAGIGIDLTH